jgi:hypothetical protein
MDMKTFLMRGAAAALLLAGTTAHAISLGFSPSDQVAPRGSSVDVDVVISGLGDGLAPSLSAFDLVISFDPTVLGLSGANIGDPVLGGDQLDLGQGSIPEVFDLGSGKVRLRDVSLDFLGFLDFLQPGSFTLARLTFDAMALGTSPLEIMAPPGLSDPIFGDTNGDPLAVDLATGSVTVVPEPGTITLFLMGSVALGMAWRRAAV